MTARIRALLLATVLATAGTAACSDEPSGNRQVTALRISAPTIVVDVGGMLQLTVVGVTASGATVPVSGVTWESLEPGIASVDEQGLVRGLAEGVARIVATSGAVADTFRVSVGGRLVFNVSASDACSTADERDARIVAVSDRAIIAEDLSNPAGGFTDQEYASIAATFDTLIYPVVTAAFGEPGDIDANQRVLILYTRAVNELTGPGSRSFVSGFFFSRDLFPTESRDGFEGCRTSNEAELFYMLAPDPSGEVNGNERTKEFVLERTLATIGHEFQHLINASRRLFETNATSFETLWLNEGLSHIAEELLFYEAGDAQPGQRIGVEELRRLRARVTAFNMYAAGNFGRLAQYVKDPAGESPYDDDDDLETRGATWSFLRYAADRSERPELAIWQALAGSPSTGFANLDAALGTPVRRWVADWAVAHAADRFRVSGSVPPVFALQSWDLTGIFSELDLPLLATEDLSSGETLDLSLVPGGSAYVRFRIGSGGSPSVTATRAGGSEPPACNDASRRSPGVGEVLQGALAELGALCLTPASGGGTQDFVLVATNASGASAGRVSLRVRGTDLLSPSVASRVPSASGPTLARARQLQALEAEAAGFERTLRELERRELEWRMPGGGAAFRPEVTLQTSGTEPEVVLSLLRLR